ncbi:hypothetical protein BDDG_04136 [Blastomyces dermatitidis ATCC 18188]|uniref:Protein BIG1 n=2 Tax=Ajellomyces dermatitidis TaxID=5039 RepID=F2TD84_AJEDA|nr:hypothetical protein BDDG_04136 [Blastomyces dermatitidis ATCC 18188]EQL34929.1 hypothetical protein BDFG_03362 [Blastomyces dermatitidis ATCC 26199]
MWINGLGLFALASSAAVTTVDAFRDTSPFFLFSTHETAFPVPSRQFEAANTLSTSLSTSPALKSCSAATYILISQPGVHARDYSSGDATPRLRRRVLKLDEEVKGSFAVSEVVGRVDVDTLQGVLEEGCGVVVERVDVSGTKLQTYTKTPLVLRVDFASVAADSNRSEQLVKNDEFLDAIIDRLPSRDYTVLYTTTPREFTPAGIETEEPAIYNEIDTDIYQNPLRTNMNRDTAAHSHVRRDGEGDGKDDGDEQWRNQPLFEKYQFLSPGIFMGLMGGLLFALVTYVGLSALLSLKVSYAAFEKDNSPAAAKKQQ